MKESTQRNGHAMMKLAEASKKRTEAIDKQTDAVKQQFHENEFNFARQQRPIALSMAIAYVKENPEKNTTEAVLENAQKFFEFLIEDGFYEESEKSSLVKL
jgi:hypothetical protein